MKVYFNVGSLLQTCFESQQAQQKKLKIIIIALVALTCYKRVFFPADFFKLINVRTNHYYYVYIRHCYCNFDWCCVISSCSRWVCPSIGVPRSNARQRNPRLHWPLLFEHHFCRTDARGTQPVAWDPRSTATQMEHGALWVCFSVRDFLQLLRYIRTLWLQIRGELGFRVSAPGCHQGMVWRRWNVYLRQREYLQSFHCIGMEQHRQRWVCIQIMPQRVVHSVFLQSSRKRHRPLVPECIPTTVPKDGHIRFSHRHLCSSRNRIWINLSTWQHRMSLRFLWSNASTIAGFPSPRFWYPTWQLK